METSTQRQWYTKKRYVIPGIIIAGFMAIGIFVDTPQDVKTKEGGEIEIKQIAPAPETKQEEVTPEPEIEVEEKTTEEVVPTPNPTSTKNDKVSPAPTPKLTPPPVVKPKETSSCDSNYSGCVPIASDVDCAGGSGNGPAYVRGPVYVIGSDIYDLDRDGDGVACE